MTRVFLADAHREERAALRLLLQDLGLELVGETGDWLVLLARFAANCPDMLVLDSDLLPGEPAAAFERLRLACPRAVVLLSGRAESYEQAARAAGIQALTVIGKTEPPERVAERLRLAAQNASIPSG